MRYEYEHETTVSYDVMFHILVEELGELDDGDGLAMDEMAESIPDETDITMAYELVDTSDDYYGRDFSAYLTGVTCRAYPLLSGALFDYFNTKKTNKMLEEIDLNDGY